MADGRILKPLEVHVYRIAVEGSTLMIDGGHNRNVCISQVTDDTTVAYAATELAKYLGYIMHQAVVVGLSGIRIGVISDFPELTTPDVTEPVLDDAIDIDVRNDQGYIAGVNLPGVCFFRHIGISTTGLPMGAAGGRRRVHPDSR